MLRRVLRVIATGNQILGTLMYLRAACESVFDDGADNW